MGERRPCKAEVVGSIPISSTRQIFRLRFTRPFVLAFHASVFDNWTRVMNALRYRAILGLAIKLLRAYGGCLGAGKRRRT